MKKLSAVALLILLLQLASPAHSPGGARQKSAPGRNTSGKRGGAIVQAFAWKQQEITLAVPRGWRAADVQEEELLLIGPDGARLHIDVLNNDKDFVVEAALRQAFEHHTKLQSSGDSEDVRYLQVGGVRGVHYRCKYEVGSEQRSCVAWVGWRRYKSRAQYISLTLSAPAAGFNNRKGEFYAILDSIKLTQN